MNEIWKDIEGYEGTYQVSNTGKVKRIKTLIKCKNGHNFTLKEHYIYLNDKGGNYLTVNLNKENKTKRFYVHRLVAKAFIENVNNKSEVNHIDGNKHNNKVKNLEWVTRSENLKHAWDNELFDREKRRNIARIIALNNRNIYKVYRYNVKTKEIKEYEKIQDTFSEFERTSVYSSIKNGKQYKGYIFSKNKDFSKFENEIPFAGKNIKINETKAIRLSRFIEKLERRKLNIENYEKIYKSKTQKGEKLYLFFKKDDAFRIENYKREE